MAYTASSSTYIEDGLVQGLWIEAEWADRVVTDLNGLRNGLPESSRETLLAVSEEIRSCGRLLRDLSDCAQVHVDKIPVVLNYLNIILPCLKNTMRNITTYTENKSLSREIRWRKMCSRMTDEVAGQSLQMRFALYNRFLSLLKLLLMRSPDLDVSSLEVLRLRILNLRALRGIPAPDANVGAALVRQMPSFAPSVPERSIHWGERIFNAGLSSRTAFRDKKRSKSKGPHVPYGTIQPPSESKILFRSAFDNDRISLIAYLNSADQSPYLLLRSFHQGMPWYSQRGAHELRISREACAVKLKRWSRSEQCGKTWARLVFATWEELVLFYCAFLSLKARNTLTVQIHPDEYKLFEEKRLFQAQIIDDGYNHSLIVYEDTQTGGIRLMAAVWEGELRQCPVWTAFVTHQSRSSTWLSRKSSHVIRLKDVQLYVFCQRYNHEHMRRNKAGAFEIYFNSQEGASRFKQIFDTHATPDSSEANRPHAAT